MNDLAAQERLKDRKLKVLTAKCKQTKNYKKLATVFLIEIRNTLETIAVKLCLQSFKGPSHKFMVYMNDFLQRNFHFTLFREEQIETLRGVETIFTPNSRDIGLYHVKNLISLYYALREIEVPNFFTKSGVEEMETVGGGFHSYLHFRSQLNAGAGKSQKVNRVNALILHKLNQKKKRLEKELKKGYDKGTFKAMVRVKASLRTMQTQEGKNPVDGPLHKNVTYKASVSRLVPFTFVGAGVLFLGLTFMLLFEAAILPIAGALSLLTMCFGGAGTFILLFYWLKFRS